MPGQAVLPAIIAILLVWFAFGVRGSIAITLLLVTLPVFFALNALLAVISPPRFKVVSSESDRLNRDAKP